MLSNFTFSEHLQHLFDVIAILDPQETQQLLHFNLFIHHRAYRKLGWRVQEFVTHWDKSPFDFISAHLGPELEPMELPIVSRNALFGNLIDNYCKVPDKHCASATVSRDVYYVNAENASDWVGTLKYLWGQLEDSLLEILPEPDTSVENTKKPPRVTKSTPVRRTSPDSSTVITIVSTMFSLEALMPVFMHLLTAEGVAQALADAG